MSLYNLVNGVKPAVFFVLPMLGKHPEEYPRFRDCFLSDEDHPEYDSKIIVYTRTGGGNRDAYVDENNAIRSMPGFIADYDDSFDSTFACWVFEVPSEFKNDFEKIVSGGIKNVSAEYQSRLRSVYPKLKERWDELFGARESTDGK